MLEGKVVGRGREGDAEGWRWRGRGRSPDLISAGGTLPRDLCMCM